jgi:hypothetical protein
VEVKVTFCDLTPTDREALGSKYAPPQANRFTAWRTYESGVDKFTGAEECPVEPGHVLQGITAAIRRFLIH